MKSTTPRRPAQVAICRPATIDDLPELLCMMQELAHHEGDAAELLTDATALAQAGFGESLRFGAVLGEVDGALAGFVSYTWTYSVWRDAKLMNLDDVYVRAGYRNGGIGEALMQHVRSVARAAGASRLRWEAKPHNNGAIRFYERLGAPMRLKSVFFWPVRP
ncbi:GNAT family N-acetyltransferase [Roseateles sp.]|uniref:GNAT family N-acetyltransferase n=1 Tax=Roseateles sp. TaxID=1971397 RepID=UPI0039EB2F37